MGEVHRGAHLSGDGVYRYTLSRLWDTDPGGVEMVWVMLNPSTADAAFDDPTIRRCMGFARAWGYAGIRVVNLFGLRATDPKTLIGHRDPVGPDNDHWLSVVTTERMTVAAWGSNAMAAIRAQSARKSLPETLWCLGRTKSGAPKHPLYVTGTTKPTRWSCT